MKTPVNSFPPARRTHRRFTGLCASALLASFAFTGQAHADVTAPAFSSNPGAAYTLYLDFGGFAYTGMWADATPGTTPAYNGATTAFTAQDNADIKAVWAGVSQQYAGFNINVTTLDPAVAAGQAGTDFARQTFYANTPNMMHTVIGSALRGDGSTQWTGAAGISFQGTTTGTEDFTGGHTNWVVTQGLGYNETGNIHYIAQNASHENGHGLGLGHQSDYVGTTQVNDYGIGDNNANGSKTGPGTYGSIMGDGNFAQRLAFRVGSTSDGGTGALQNDVGRILSTNTAANAASQGRAGGVDLHLKADGIGQTMATATALPLTGTNVNFNLASGVIVPKNEMGPVPIDASNYTVGYFKFTLSATSTITLTAHDGTQFLTAGVADPESPFHSTMLILSATGATVGTALEAADTLSETYIGTLAAGSYYALVSSFGGHTEVDDPAANFNPSNFYDMGAYFLTGSGFTAVPEPSTWVLMLLGGGGVLGVVRRRRGQPILS